MDYLFSEFRIKGVELKNRIVMPALASFLTEEAGRITERTIEHYRRRAAGGPAMVMMEACAVSAEGIVSAKQTRIYDDQHIEGLAKIARVIESEGAIPAVQLHHGGRQISPRVIKRKPLAPSALPCPTIRAEVEPLTVEGIQRLVQLFGDAAQRAKQAGYKLIEIHGAHGYLINQFLSGFSNIRQDRYGGDVFGRTLFAKEIVEEIRKRVGEDFPISFKISAQEFVPNGLTVEESIKILKILVEAGIDIVQISAGCDATPEWICQPMFMEKACLVDSAQQTKAALNIPVMAVGRINDPAVANRIIKENKADLVCVARGLLADPEMPKKAREGRLEDIRVCIACNTCMQSIFRKGRVECLVNPSLGREAEMEIRPAGQPRKILVIGGGPAGMNAAWVAAKRGHDVHLFEKNNALGGQLIPGSIPEYKKEVRSLIRFQKRQMEKFGVKCYLNQEATLSTIKEMNPDVVIVATGAVPCPPPFEIPDNDIVVPLEAVLNGNVPVPKRTVIIGGGATGCELALHLARSGSSVTVVEMLPKIGSNLEAMTRKILIRKLNEHDVKIMTEAKLSSVENNGARVVDKDGVEWFLEADAVIVSIGFQPDSSLYEQIKSSGYEVYQIGDCVEPRNAKDAIYEAAVLGRTI
ncbi:MAG: FAD-dependent oxidoreductase [Deltaproteobacteria bacterium]|nr:FAD-dependent oxidoreductase [Deltaproteobacteria bacterium]MBW1961820.1 FAD-dependent oxidoreductase [Deltaproteobacteria bacterium]MBW2151350.1 FAD-dependent oxidoreductase [Deltaproteobacteria bacterium]